MSITSTAGNPFLAGKLEHEKETTIFVTGDVEGFFDWISAQQYLFMGLRGSGKSSILRSIEWDVAWHVAKTRVEGSPQINRFLKDPPKYLGARFWFEDMDTRYWDRWQEKVGREWAQKYFGTYLEYSLLYVFTNALMGVMQKSPVMFKNPNFEKRLVDEMVPTCFPEVRSRPRLPEPSLSALRSIIRDQTFSIRDLVYRNIDADAMACTFPVLSPGSLMQQFSNTLVGDFSEFCDWKIFPLLDDCNHVTEWQMQVINSAISRAKAPLAYKITSVSGLLKSRETIDGRPVKDHELKKISISGSSEASWTQSRKFEKIVQGVCKTRIARVYGDTYAARFDFKTVLGKFELEPSLIKTIQASEKREAINLWHACQNSSKAAETKKSITAIWLSRHRVRVTGTTADDDPIVQKRLMRRIESMYTKKWRYAAAVAICQDQSLKLPFPYHGWSTVLHLSSGSIREMLRIMAEIWDEVNLPIDGFVNQKGIDLSHQRRAIKKAAQKLMDGIDDKPLFQIDAVIDSTRNKTPARYKPTSLRSICERLGTLFAKLQSYPAVCVTPESASLKVLRKDLDPEVIDAINFAVMVGVILIMDDVDEPYLTVGLHPMLSPLFDISFRNPFYYPVSPSITDFVTLFKGDHTAAQHAIDNIVIERVRHLPGHEQDLPDHNQAGQLGMLI